MNTGPTGTGSTLHDGLTRLKTAAMQVRLYPRDSLQVRRAADAFCDAVHVCADATGRLTLSGSARGLLVNGRLLPEEGPASAGVQSSLLDLLRDAGISSVTFHDGITGPETVTFLLAFQNRFWESRHGPAINRRLREEGVTRAAVDEDAPPAMAAGGRDVRGPAGAAAGFAPDPSGTGRSDRPRLADAAREPGSPSPRGPGAAGVSFDTGLLTLRGALDALGELAHLLPAVPPAAQDALRRVGRAIADAFRGTPHHEALLREIPPERPSAPAPAAEPPSGVRPSPVPPPSASAVPSAPPARSRVAAILEGRDPARAGKALLDALLEETDLDARVDLVETLGRLRAREAVEPLGRVVKSRTEPTVVRCAACLALGQIGDPHAVAPLAWAAAKGPLGMTQILKSVPPVVRAAALRALSAYADDPAARAVLERGRSDSDASIRAAVVEPAPAPAPAAPRDRPAYRPVPMDIADPLEERGFPKLNEDSRRPDAPSSRTLPAAPASPPRPPSPPPVRPPVAGRERSEAERADREQAREIQEKLVPNELPPLSGWDAAHAYLPASDVGGDYLDAFPLEGERAGFVVGDVSGKGISGALVMVMVRSAFRASAPGRVSPAETVAAVNRLVRADIKPGMFVSIIYACLHLPTGELTLVNCGHNPPVVREGGALRARLLGNRGLPLGVAGSERFDASLREESIRFAAGDRILLYTDGVVEAMNEREEEFGEEAFLRVVNEQGAQPPRALVDAVVSALAAHRGVAPPSDDITLLDLRRRIS